MRKMILILLVATVIILGKGETYAQTAVPKDNSCQPSTEEILSLIKSVYNWSPPLNGISIAGEVRGWGQLRLPEEQLSLMRVVAMIGGVSKNAGNSVYLIRQSPENGMKTK